MVGDMLSLVPKQNSKIMNLHYNVFKSDAMMEKKLINILLIIITRIYSIFSSIVYSILQVESGGILFIKTCISWRGKFYGLKSLFLFEFTLKERSTVNGLRGYPG